MLRRPPGNPTRRPDSLAITTDRFAHGHTAQPLAFGSPACTNPLAQRGSWSDGDFCRCVGQTDSGVVQSLREMLIILIFIAWPAVVVIGACLGWVLGVMHAVCSVLYKRSWHCTYCQLVWVGRGQPSGCPECRWASPMHVIGKLPWGWVGGVCTCDLTESTPPDVIFKRSSTEDVSLSVRAAAESCASLWIRYVDMNGHTSEQVVKPLCVSDGFLTAEGAAGEQIFQMRRIASVVFPAEESVPTRAGLQLPAS